MDNYDLCFKSARDIASMIATRKVSAKEVTEAVLERIELVEPKINSYITVCADIALAEAEAADKIQASGNTLGPLHGVPIGVKDLLNTKGVKTTFASKALANNLPDTDSVPIARLRGAGAILVGKTTTPEFGHKPMTEAPLFGETRNPWNLKRTSGGSSGGAAAAVAAGLAPLHVGTDAGGSIRIPAAACGVVGMKQTLGLVPHDMNADTFGLFSYIGPITRTVSDAGLLLSVMGGRHSSDVHSLNCPAVDGLAKESLGEGDLNGVKIGWRLFLGNETIDTETKVLFEKALSVFRELGAELIPCDGPFTPTLPIWEPITFSAFAVRYGGLIDQFGDKITETLRYWTGKGRNYSSIDLQNAIHLRTKIFREVQCWFQEIDLLVTPTLSRPALDLHHDPRDPIEIGGQILDEPRASWYPYTHPFNMTGHPAITVPSGWTTNVLPVGLQIVGPWMADGSVLHAAACFERARPWTGKHPILD